MGEDTLIMAEFLTMEDTLTMEAILTMGDTLTMVEIPTRPDILTMVDILTIMATLVTMATPGLFSHKFQDLALRESMKTKTHPLGLETDKFAFSKHVIYCYI